MKLKIDGIAFFYVGFILVIALLIAGLYTFLGITGIVLGTICMVLGIYLYQAQFYISIDTTDEEDKEEDEKDIR